MPDLDIRISASLCGQIQGSERAEIQAAVTALKIASLYQSEYTSVTLRTDSLNVFYFARHWERLWTEAGWPQIRMAISKLSYIKYPACQLLKYENDWDELFEIIAKLKQKKNFTVHWQKVRAHTQEPGNETSDMLSKLGRKLPYNNDQLFKSFENSLKLNVDNTYSKLFRPNLTKLLIIQYVPVHISVKNVLSAFKFDAAVVEVKNAHRGVHKDIVLRVTQKVFVKALRLRELDLDDHITVPIKPTIRQCIKCLKIGHSTTFCTKSIERCAICAEYGHNWTVCKVHPTSPRQDFCGNCLDKNLPGTHPAFSSLCPLRIHFQQKLARQTLFVGAKRKLCDIC